MRAHSLTSCHLPQLHRSCVDAQSCSLAYPHRPGAQVCTREPRQEDQRPGEEEYLFAPYSAFTVLSVSWNAGTIAAPHEIELLAAVDNKAEREDLPLAPWS